MDSDELIDLLAEILLVLPIIGFVGSLYLWRIYHMDDHRPRSWVLFSMGFVSTLVVVVSIVTAVLAKIRLDGQSLGEAGGVALVLVVLSLEVIPGFFAISVYLHRNGGPPENGPIDE